MAMIVCSAIKEEMLKSGYTAAGAGECEKCHEQVEYLQNPSGTRKIAVNPSDHAERPNGLHILGCGVKQE